MRTEEVGRHEYDACRARCDERCGACHDEMNHITNRMDEMEDEMQSISIAIAVNNLKWIVMSFIGSLLGGILTIVLAAILISHYGIGQPQYDIDPPLDSGFSVSITTRADAATAPEDSDDMQESSSRSE